MTDGKAPSEVSKGFARSFGGCFGLLAAIVVLIVVFGALGRGCSPETSDPTATGDNVHAANTWRTSTSKSAMDDTKEVTLSLDAEADIPNSIGLPTRPTLFVRCKEDETEVYINWDVYLGLDSISTQYRLDAESAQTEEWSISTDNKAAFSPASVPFVKDMIAKKKLVVRITPYGENPVESTFTIDGLSKYIGPVRSACHW